MNIARSLKQTVTHWRSVTDGFGGYTYGTPRLLKGRWEDIAKLFRTATGDEAVSRSVVYLLDSDVDVGDWIALGDFVTTSTPAELAGAVQVRQSLGTPDLRSLKSLYEVII